MRRMIPALVKGLLLAWLCSLSVPLSAATVAGLYEAEVPVAGEDPDRRNQAIGEALQQVLVRLTGRAPAPGAVELLPQAPGYVQQYRYVRTISPEGEPSTGLWVRFDKLGLDRALRERGLPLWGENRPGVLVWLGAEQAGQRELVGPDSELAEALRSAARARGLPLQWPLLDLEDQARLTTADLWSDYAPAVKQASARYARPLVLAGRLRQVAPDHWDGRWTLYEGDTEQSLSSTGSDGAQAVAGAVAQVTDLLAARYAPAGGADGPAAVRLRIDGVQGVADYARVIKLIGGREVVDRVELRSASGDSLVLEVSTRGGRDALAQVLDLTRGLSREPDPLPAQPIMVPSQPLPPIVVGPAPLPGQPEAPVVDGGATTAPAAPVPPPPETEPQAPPVDLIYRVTS